MFNAKHLKTHYYHEVPGEFLLRTLAKEKKKQRKENEFVFSLLLLIFGKTDKGDVQFIYRSEMNTNVKIKMTGYLLSEICC